MSQPIFSSLALDDWFEAYASPAPPMYQPTTLEAHPHPLRSHSKELKRLPESDRRAGRSDVCVSPYSKADGTLHRTRIIPMADIDNPPVPKYQSSYYASTTRHNLSISSSSKDFPIVAIRPPLRPSTSFGGESLGSYNSYTSLELDKKSLKVAAQEIADEIRRNSSTRRFYSCLGVLCLLNVMSGLNVTSLATALPTVTKELRVDPVPAFWIVIASLLATAIFHPLYMRLSALDSKLLLVFGLVLVTGGSLASALARGSSTIILGRSMEGCGSAAIRVLTQLILDQLTTNDVRRGCEIWIPAAFWVGTALGPIIGGALAKTAGWPYIFYINVPFMLIGGTAIPLLVRLPGSTESTWQRIKKVDILGWILLSAACTSIILALSWAGTVHSWSSWPVLLPLLLGVAVIVIWAVYSRYRIHPILPVSSFSRASAIFPCIGTMIHGLLFTAIIYMAAKHLQSALSRGSIVSGLFLLSWTVPFAIVAIVAAFALRDSHLHVASGLGWTLATTGLALMSVLTTHSSPALVIAIGILTGAALGLLASLLRTAVQRSATTDDETIHAGPMHSFFSSLGMSLGVAVASCIYLNQDAQGEDVTSSLRCVWVVMSIFSSTALVLSILSAVRVHKTPGRIEMRLVSV